MYYNKSAGVLFFAYLFLIYYYYQLPPFYDENNRILLLYRSRFEFKELRDTSFNFFVEVGLCFPKNQKFFFPP